MAIIPNRKIFYIFSGTLLLASIISLLVFGLKTGIDFTGGSLLEVEYSEGRVPPDEIRGTLEGFGLGNIVIQETENEGFILRFKEVDEDTHQKILSALRGGGGGVFEKRFVAIGPTIGCELKERSLWAIFVVLFLIVLYIAWAFRRVSKPVSSWKYGVVALIALFHDVLIPVGLFSILGRFVPAEVDTLFVTALLTILGFSVHDTIVVFDRIRENLKKAGSRIESFGELVEGSVKETFVRSINTSFTVLLSLSAVFLFGGESVKYFTLALIVGVVAGTYSSIFIASPLLVTWQEWEKDRKK